MSAAPVPLDENDRLEALRSMEILDTPPERNFDSITRLVTRALGVPVATISLVDEHRQWFKSCIGLSAKETPRKHAFCAHAILSDEPLVVTNALEDARFADSPLVTETGIRFYAGVPLKASSGHSIGALCAIDFEPREISDEELEMLRDLAAVAENLLETRIAATVAKKHATDLQLADHRFEMLSEATRDVIWDLNLVANEVWWNENLSREFGYAVTEETAQVQWWAERVHPDERERVVEGLHEAIESDAANWVEEYRFLHADGHYVPVYDRACIIRDSNGRAIRALGAMFDLTEARRSEQLLRDHSLVIEHSNIVLFRWKPEPGWPVELVSENVSQFGYSDLELLERRVLYADIIHPDDLARINDEVAIFAAKGLDRYEQEYRIVCRDGSVRWVYDRSMIEHNEEGEIIAWNGVVLDITDRKNAEAQRDQLLRDLQERIKETQTLAQALQIMHNGTHSVSDALQNIVNVLPAGFQYPDKVGVRLRLGEQCWSSHNFEEGQRRIAVPLDCKCGSGELEVVLLDSAAEDQTFFVEEERQLLMTVAVAIESYLRRRVAEDTLRQHKIVVENSNTLLFRWRVAPDWPVETVSENISQYGYTAEEVLSGRVPFAAIVHPDDRGWVEREVLDCYERNQNSLVQEYRILCRNGEVRWVLDRTSAERNADGTVTHYQGIVIDITERKLAEMALRESEERMRRIASQVPGAVYRFRLDPDGSRCFPFISDGVQSVCGLSPEELYADPSMIATMVVPEDRERFEESILKSAETMRPWREEFRIRLPDGTVRWISGNSVPQKESQGAVIWHGLIMDVTEQKEVINAKQRLTAIMEASKDFVGLADAEGNAIYINPAGRQMLGLGEDEPLDGKSIATFSPQWALDIIFGEGLPAAIEHGHWIGDTAILTMDQREIPVSQLIMAHKDADGEVEYFSTVVRDITMQKKAMTIEAERRRAEAASHAKSEFLAHMSHEIRSPMTAILGSAELLLEAGQPEEERREAIEGIRRNGSHLLSIINDILDLSKIEAGQMVVEQIPCSVQEIISQVAAFAQPRARGKDLRFSVAAKGPVPETIVTDPTRLQQILINLVGNAIKFTETGSVSVQVELRNRIGAGEPRLRFVVTDTGIGMAREQINSLFQPFVQADSSTTRRFGGTGLGLTISQHLARALGGTIEVKSAPGEGSEFTVDIEAGPLAGVRMLEDLCEPDGSEIDKRRETASGAARLTGRILLVEDAPDNQKVLRAYMERAGLDVAVANNGKMACELVAQRVPFDLILMDMQMPVMDGYEATAKIRDMGYRGPIAALTAHAMVEDREKCFAAGCTDYLTKPIRRADLLAAIERLLAGAASSASKAEQHGDEEEEILREFRTAFIAGLPAEVNTLQRSLSGGKLEDIGRIAHRLAGTTGMYRLHEISESASSIEGLVTGGAAIESIVHEVKELVRLIREVPGYEFANESRAPHQRHNGRSKSEAA